MGMFLRRGPAPHRARLSDLEIGQTIKLNLNGTPWDWLVVHQGLPSSIYDASCDGTWLLLKDCYENRQWNSSNVNELESSTIQSYLNGDFLQLFDPKVQSAIKQVKIPYRSGGGTSGTDQSGANGLTCKIFLLSVNEVGGGDVLYAPQDGSKLDYFNSTTGADAKRIAYMSGAATDWWTRSPRTDQVFRVNTRGSIERGACTRVYGIRPAIILPSDFIITDDMLAA